MVKNILRLFLTGLLYFISCIKHVEYTYNHCLALWWQDAACYKYQEMNKQIIQELKNIGFQFYIVPCNMYNLL